MMRFLGHSRLDVAAAHAMRTATRAVPYAREDAVLDYLRSGYMVLDVMEQTSDILDGAAVAESGSLVTDGAWLWRADLVHYVAKYHLELPSSFLAHAQASDFSVPEITDASLELLMPSVLEAWAIVPLATTDTTET